MKKNVRTHFYFIQLVNNRWRMKSIGTATVGVVGVQTSPKFWTWVFDTATFWQLGILLQFI